MTRSTKVFDIECYRNYFLVMFMDVETKETQAFELYDDKKLDAVAIKKILETNCVVSFNGRNYDVPLLTLALTGATNEMLKQGSDAIIVGSMKFWEFEKHYGVRISEALDHIDLIEVAPGRGSLKIYGGRLHARRIQDLPIEPSAIISPKDREDLKTYCANDLQTTLDLYNFLTPQIDLRRRMTTKFNLDLRSKSDAQIAEAVIKKHVEKMRGGQLAKPNQRKGETFYYKTPKIIKFKTDQLKAVLKKVEESPFVIAETGYVDLPPALADSKIPIGESVYRMGIGGLHSSEETVAYRTDADHVIVDRDVASYYPSIILALGLYPKGMGNAFLHVYKGVVEARLKAKHDGNKVVADALKITVNGSFGKFGSKYSYLYSPDLLIQTTLTGQLALLMLIESLELEGIQAVSANTDGVVIKCPRNKIIKMADIIIEWELFTGFDTEETKYDAIFCRDVNNYIALKAGGGVKTKGAYAPAGLQKNPTNEICVEAVIAYLENGTPPRTTILACRDIQKFVTVRACTGGAVKNGEILGKAVRWYYAWDEFGTINYRTSGNIVARSLGAQPLMALTDSFPDDVDFEWYEAECESILEDIGAVPRKPVVKKGRRNARIKA